MNGYASLVPCVSGNGSVAGTYQAVQDSGEAFFCACLDVMLDDVSYVWAWVKLEAAVALAVALQTGGSSFLCHDRPPPAVEAVGLEMSFVPVRSRSFPAFRE
jgi:hypothetical protein